MLGRFLCVVFLGILNYGEIVSGSKKYQGLEHRKCPGCEDDRALLQRISGGNKVRNWLLGLLVVAFLAGSYVARADDTQIALNAEAIKALQKLAEQNTLDHRDMQDDRNDKHKELLLAIRRIGR